MYINIYLYKNVFYLLSLFSFFSSASFPLFSYFILHSMLSILLTYIDNYRNISSLSLFSLCIYSYVPLHIYLFASYIYPSIYTDSNYMHTHPYPSISIYSSGGIVCMLVGYAYARIVCMSTVNTSMIVSLGFFSGQIKF